MTHEKILKRSDGTKISIRVNLWLDSIDGCHWDVIVYKCAPRKRTFYSVNNTDDYSWRKLDAEGRKRATIAAYLEVVSAEEILSAKMELYNAIKPTL